MAGKRDKPEDVVLKLRQVEVSITQDIREEWASSTAFTICAYSTSPYAGKAPWPSRPKLHE